MPFIVIAAVAALGGLLFGYDTGVISGALLFIRVDMHLGPTLEGLVVAIALAGAAFGAATAGQLSDQLGRRLVIFGAALLFVVGALLSAVAPGIAVLLVGRVVIGFAIGVASMLTPLYLAEIAPAEQRGAVVSLNQLCITVGILLSYGVSYAFAGAAEGWRWMLGVGLVPGAILAAGILVMPESPRWLVSHNRGDEAERVLQGMRGADRGSAEFAGLRQDIAHDRLRQSSWSEILSPRVRWPLIIGVGLAMFQQITGINTVIYFAPTIFQSAGLSSAATSILATAGVGVVNVLLTIVSIRLIDNFGRRKLLLWSLAGMAAALLALSIIFFVGAKGGVAWFAVVAVAVFVGFFAIGLGPVFWLLIAEIFPLGLRGRAMSLATIANWGFNLVVSLTFLDLVGAIGSSGAFLLYTILSLAALAFVSAYVPETKGRSLEQIEAALDADAARPGAHAV